MAGKIVSLLTDLGERVNKGQRLLILNSPQFSQAKAELLQFKTSLDLKQKEYERAKILLAQKAIEKKEFLRREAEFYEAAIRYDVAKCNLRSLGFSEDQTKTLLQKCESLNNNSDSALNDPYLAIISPISGRIIFREAIIGEHIEPDKILFTVSDLSSPWAILDAYEKDLPYIKKDSSVIVTTSLYPGRVFKGKIGYISDKIDEKLRTVKVRVIVQNKNYLLKPNMFIMGTIENKSKTHKLLCVPEEAVQNMNGKKVVFLQEEGEVFIPQEVKTVEFSVKQKLFIIAATIIALFLGIISYQKLPIDAFPDPSPCLVQIYTEAEGMAPEEVERLISYPIEASMFGLPRVKNIRSFSTFALSMVSLYFKDGTDIYFALQLVTQRLPQVRAQLPPQAKDPQLGPISTGLGLVYLYYLEGKGYSPLELRTIQDWIIKFDL